MRHYQIEEWVDYVRGLVQVRARLEMGKHLAEGCPECREAVRFLEGVVEAARNERQYEAASTSLISEAVRAFAQSGLSRIAPGLDRDLRTLVAILKYDSTADWQIAGSRGLETQARHLLYEAGDYAVDIRLESDDGGEALMATGQIAHRGALNSLVSQVPVMLFSGGRLLVKAQTTPSGEFYFEYSPAPSLRLVVLVRSAGEQIHISLDPLNREYDHVEVPN